MIFHKNKIIKALTVEPLRDGLFFHTSSEVLEEGKPDLMKCEVCAVGAVLRAHLGNQLVREKSAVELALKVTSGKVHVDVKNVDEHLGILITDKNYLGALSVLFENLMENKHKNTTILSIRKKCIEFVKVNFPKKFELEVRN